MQRFFDVVTDRFGNPAQGVSVYVLNAETGFPANLFLGSEDAANPTSPIANPFTTDSSGVVLFACADGAYTISYDGPNVSPRMIPWYVMGSRSATWGSIGGNILNQTDLQAQFSTINTSLANKQPLDGDLTSIAAISSNGYAKKTGVDTWISTPTIGWSELTSIPTFNGSTAGIVPVSDLDITKFLRADGAFASAGGVRSTATYTTATLAVGALETGSITIPKSVKIWKLVSSHVSWFRLYKSASQQTSDLSRADFSTSPGPNHGCMLEVETTDSLTWDLSPEAPITLPTGTTAYVTVKNIGTASAQITTTLSLLSEES